MNSVRLRTVMLSGLILLTVGVITQAGWRSEGPFCGQINCVAIEGNSPGRLHAGMAGGSIYSTELP